MPLKSKKKDYYIRNKDCKKTSLIKISTLNSLNSLSIIVTV